jgi:prepilin signal peptidase PulO-like enzyme (type II secretory pathway)
MMGFLIGLSILAWYDYHTYTLPDGGTLSLLLGGLCWHYYEGKHFETYLLGATFGYGLLATVAIAHRLLYHKEGLGGGDCKYMGAIGAIMGLQAVGWVSTLGATLGILGHRYGKFVPTKNGYQPFGPYLAIAAWIVYITSTHVCD